jgi:hypothetical protein
MVDKENLGDNNMSSEQVGEFHRGSSSHGLSHAVFLKSILFDAKRHSERKHAYITNVMPLEALKRKKISSPRVSGFRVHSQMLLK